MSVKVTIFRCWFIFLVFSQVIINILFPNLSFAKEEKSQLPPPSITALRTLQTPVIDGVLDEPAWIKAAETSPFLEHRSADPVSGKAAARVIYDEKAIYIGVRMEVDDPASLHAPQRKDGDHGIFGDEGVEIFLDPDATRTRYNQFIVTASLSKAACSNGDFAAPLVIEAATSASGDAWILETRILFDNFGAAPALGDRWGLNVCHNRAGQRKGDGYHAAWSPTYGGLQTPGRFGYVIFGGIPGQPQPLDPPDTRVTKRILDCIEAESRGRSIWGPEDLSHEEKSRRAVRLIELNSLLARFPSDVLPFVRPAISDIPVLPWTVPALNETNQAVRVSACRGEFEPASLGIFAVRDLRKVLLVASEFVSSRGDRLPASVADLYQVKCWYQGGSGAIQRGKTTLTPELLLKNGDIVKLDPKSRVNVLQFKDLPQDSETLQPVDIPAFHTQQYWITFHIPEETAPGDYEGHVAVQVNGEEKTKVPVYLTVHDFELEPSRLLYSLYYTLRLPSAKESEARVRAMMDRMGQEIRNQVEHGITSPSTYVNSGSLPWDPDPLAALQAVMDMQKAAGVTQGPFICVTITTGRLQPEDVLAKLREQASKLAEFARKNGRGPFFYQGIDEAKADVLAQELPAFKAVNEGGAKVFVACGPVYWDIVGKWLNMPVLAGPLLPDFVKMVHENAPETRVLSYYNPQAGIERPEVYRRNYGLKLWAAGYDGAMDWQYQGDAEGGAWDDFGGGHIRDETMAYPAIGRPVDTLQWEGWREGVDDVRYVGSLLSQLERLEATTPPPPEVQETREWLETVTSSENPDQIRAEIVQRILLLKSL